MATGKIIRAAAIIIAILELVFFFFLALFLMTFNRALTVLGVIAFFGGCFVSILNFLLLYGFGELIIKTAQTEENTRMLCNNVNYHNR